MCRTKSVLEEIFMKKIELVKGEKGYDEMQIAVRGKGFMIAYKIGRAHV